jgi:hypothetical protein
MFYLNHHGGEWPLLNDEFYVFDIHREKGLINNRPPGGRFDERRTSNIQWRMANVECRPLINE